MTRRIEWLPRAREDLLDIPWETAAAADATVRLFALTGVGTLVRWPNPLGPDEVRLYIPPDARYFAAIRYSKGVVYVERVLRSP